MVADESNYARLSEGTASAFARVECKTSFGDVGRICLNRIAGRWPRRDNFAPGY